jgi:hypothetical protein
MELLNGVNNIPLYKPDGSDQFFQGELSSVIYQPTHGLSIPGKTSCLSQDRHGRPPSSGLEPTGYKYSATESGPNLN